MLAPICLFTYNRPDETKQTIEALKKNNLANQSELFIFSDGPKRESSISKIEEVRHYLNTVSGFKSITIYNSPANKGLANSIIEGATQILSRYGKIIVLEDDLITSPNFLDFVNQALDFYSTNQKIYSISGYSMDLPSLKTYKKDYYLGYRASSWGWATWKDRWQDIDWEVKDYGTFKWNPLMQMKFMRAGSDMPLMLRKQMNGKIDSWAIRWCYHQFKQDQVTVFPSKSKVISIGFGENATHTKKTKRFITALDPGDQINFQFDKDPSLNFSLQKEFKEKFSVIQRIKDKLT